jgi:hypothetical protein
MPTRRALLASAALTPLLAVPSAARARQATPAAGEAPLFDLAFPGVVFPAGPVSAMACRHALAPGATADYVNGLAVTGATASAFAVLAGSLALTGESPTVLRAAGAVPGASPVAGEALLGPGDAAAFALAADRAPFAPVVRNAGAATLVFVEAWVVSGRAFHIHPLFPVGEDVYDYQSYAGVDTLPSDATATLRLSRTTLAPGERRAPGDAGWQIALGDSEKLTRSPTDGAATNLTDRPLEIVVVTAVFAPTGAASPVAAPAA